MGAALRGSTAGWMLALTEPGFHIITENGAWMTELELFAGANYQNAKSSR